MRTIFCIAALLAMLMLTTSAMAQTYFKWVDDEGTVHFTAEPPQDRAYERIDTSGNVIGSSTPVTTDPTGAEDDMAEDATAMPREGQVDSEELATRCAQARENMFWLENRRRIAVERHDGTEDFVEGDDRIRMIEETQAFLDEWCQDVPG